MTSRALAYIGHFDIAVQSDSQVRAQFVAQVVIAICEKVGECV